MRDPVSLSAVEMARLIREGQLTAAAVMEACLARMAAREPVVQAMAHFDPRAAMQAAEAADRKLKAGAGTGPLQGVPLGVKDVLDTADWPTTYNSPIWAGHRPRADSAAVALARRAGAIIIGKTVTTEFATREPGPTTHPQNPSHTPGGSSSGSAAGVASGFFPIAFGTQTSGSIVRPSAYCGVVGFKPTRGTINRAGMRVVSETLDTIGAIARTVADCAALVQAASNCDYGDIERKPERAPRLALSFGHAPDMADRDTQQLIDRVASAAVRAGAEVVPIELPQTVLAAARNHRTVMYGEGAQSLSWELSTAPDQLSAVLRGHLQWGAQQPPGMLEAARQVLAEAQRAFVEVTSGFDAVLTPSATGEAPVGLHSTGDPAFNLLWTALFAPCVTVPAGQGSTGLPLGIQIVARPGEDRAALTWARWLQDALG